MTVKKVSFKILKIVDALESIAKQMKKGKFSDEEMVRKITSCIHFLANAKNEFRDAVKPIEMANLIQEANEQSKLTTEQMDAIKSGFDEWSKLQLDEILTRLNSETVKTIEVCLEEAFGNNKTYKARAARWIARGLKINHAIAKVIHEGQLYGN